ncbi:MAG: carcinine hydrolase/isopenicillin-N N-acyltransferase family protein [Bacteroidales bacterium]
MLKRVIPILLLFIFIVQYAYPCTAVIISGKHTPDGRPLMWKHRDTKVFDNKLVYVDNDNNDGKYSAIGLVDSGEAHSGEIWIGFNNVGFAIMNTMSYNIEGNGAQNAYFMREALMECASVDEFEEFIKSRERPRNVRSNFGVIDAEGGAAFFETGDEQITRFNVDDTKVAPHGYIIRTNYSVDGYEIDGTGQEGVGYIRFETAEKKFYRAMGENDLSVSFLLEEMMTSLENPLSEENAEKDMKPADEDDFFYFQDCINRYTSSSSIIIQGVKENESPLLTTMWSKIGFPLSSVVVPVWITPEGSLPEVISAPENETAELCDFALELKKIMIPSTRGSRQNYINSTKVYNADGTGIVQLLKPLNRKIYEKTMEKKKEWNDELPPEDEVKQLYHWYDKKIRETYEEEFGLNKNSGEEGVNNSNNAPVY